MMESVTVLQDAAPHVCVVHR